MNIRKSLKSRRLVRSFQRRLRWKSRNRSCEIEGLEARMALSATPVPQLVKNINTDPDSSNPEQFVTVGTQTFFTANDGNHGRELWRTDGTAEGTRMVRDVNIGLGPSSPQQMTNVDGTLYFTANDGIHGTQVWKTDGTENGTTRVTNLKPGYSSIPRLGQLTNIQGELYFVYEASRFELWRSNGTASGTQRITEFTSAPRDITDANGRVFFILDDQPHGLELWTSNGTAVSTRLVKDINPGRASASPRELTAVDERLYFVADDGVHGQEVWLTDGTGEGTQLVRDFAATNQPGYELAPEGLTDVNGTLFFARSSQLWKTDGTDAGTELVKDFTPFANLDPYSRGPLTINVGGTLYFTLYNYDVSRRQLWKSDGTLEGTVSIANIIASNSEELALVQGTLFLVFKRGDRIWTSDGTAAGTQRVEDAAGPPRTIFPTLPTGTFYFARTDAEHGKELWKTDGTATGTKLVRDINPETYGMSIAQTIILNGKLIFAMNSYKGGAQLWTSDGTNDGTHYLAALSDPFRNESVENFTVVNNRLFFTVGGWQGALWTSDGTAAGTIPLAWKIRELTAVGEAIYFSAEKYGFYHGSVRYIEGLWKTDGTRDGTVLVEEIDANDNFYAANLTNVDGTLFYTTQFDYADGMKLWKTNGTPSNALLLAEIPTPKSIALGSLDGVLHFVVAKKNSNGFELWQSDGTPAGTSIIIETTEPASNGGSGSVKLVTLGNTIYFTAADAAHGAELWKSDGTAAGTKLAVEIVPGLGGAYPAALMSVGGRIYFNANTADGYYRLWSSDGTPEGTYEIGKRVTGSMVEIDGIVYFSGHKVKNGYELWRTDGTKKGTKLAADINPGTESSFPRHLVALGGELFFAADDGVSGTELWKFKPELPAPPNPTPDPDPPKPTPPKPLPPNTVTVDLKSGLLTIRGDRIGNSISLGQVTSADGKVRVKIQGSDTKITNLNSGKRGSSFTFGGVSSISVALGAGNDSLTIRDLRISGILSINLGSGNDRLSLTSVVVGGAANSPEIDSARIAIAVALGTGNDWADLADIRSLRSVSVNAGAGRDTVIITTAVVGTANSRSSLTVWMGAGSRDNLVVASSTADEASFRDDEGSDGALARWQNRFRRQKDRGFGMLGSGFLGRPSPIGDL